MIKFFQKGQATATLIIVTALLTSSGNWLLAKVLNSPDQLSAALVASQKDIAVLQLSDRKQDEAIKTMADSIEYIRRSIEKQNKLQGIIIDPKVIDVTKI